MGAINMTLRATIELFSLMEIHKKRSELKWDGCGMKGEVHWKGEKSKREDSLEGLIGGVD